MALGTPCTPKFPHKTVGPTTPQRTNRLITHFPKATNDICQTPPKYHVESTFDAPLRQNGSQRASCRQLYSQTNANDSPTAKRSHTQVINTGSQPVTNRFNNNVFAFLDNFKSTVGLVCRDSNKENNFKFHSPKLPKTNMSSAVNGKGTSVFAVFHESEPMDIEFNENYRNYMNDSMEIDNDDDISTMEVDSIVDMESFMEYIPMH
ncbi:hypothetical protein GCK72_005523 [Caenorhabditis remanei]|uniref:Uncharacterized protein n=1 Tax=Caenorhabditis remanei TaxID=31234 RepID=A0A6A5HF26_CAERE|nr:hypothetical protein GCK72_005523 [Caenorhabditis remanei]KAF1765571.1 hypothetical protein GCK72_005523 [Caenorhabditis remanei]